MKAGKCQTPYAGKGVHLDALSCVAALRRFTLPRRRNSDAGISDYSTSASKDGSPGTPSDYWSSLVTSCCTLLACARAEMPVWLRISYLDMLEVADA